MPTLFTQRGLKARIARDLGCRPGTVTKWDKAGRVPVSQCPLVERITGIRAEVLNSSVTWRRVRKAGWPNGLPVVEADPLSSPVVSAMSAKPEGVDQ